MLKIKISSSSSLERERFIQVSSIDEALRRLRCDKNLVLSVIDSDSSHLTEGADCCDFNDVEDFEFPEEFVITFGMSDCDANIEIYDTFRE